VAYTDAQIDSLFADKQKQIDMKAAKSEILALSRLQGNRIQSNENSVTAVQSDINDLNRANASLNSRILTHNTTNIFTADGNVATGTYYLMQPSTDVTVSNIKVHYAGTAVAVNLLSNSTDMLSANITGAQNTWLSGTPTGLSGGMDTGDSLVLDIRSASDVTKLTVQVDFAVG